MPANINIVIADSHPICRDGLTKLLHTSREFRVMGEADNGKTLMQLVRNKKPTVLIAEMFLEGKDNVQVIKKIRSTNPAIKILVFAECNSNEQIGNAIAAGANGYIVKSAPAHIIGPAIRKLCAGDTFYYTTTWLHKEIEGPVEQHIEKVLYPELNSKERRLIELLCCDKTMPEISRIMRASCRTLEGIRSRLINRLPVKNAAGLVMYAIRNGLYQID